VVNFILVFDLHSVLLRKKKEKSKSPGFCNNILVGCIKSKLRIRCKN